MRRKPLTVYPILVRRATEEDLPKILKIARQYPQELGFVRKVALQDSLKRKTLLVADYGDEKTVGFVNYRARKDGWNTIYEIAVHKNFKRCGVGRVLLNATPTPAQLKCTVDNPANLFYEKNGFTKTGMETGRMRPLNVWKRKVVVVLCQGSSEMIAHVPEAVGMAYGTRHTERPLFQPYFVDIRWYNYDWSEYLEKIHAWKPVFALVPDFERLEQRREMYQHIRELKQAGVLRIGVCPKFDGAVKYIPSWCIVCVSIPTKYAGFLPEQEELFGRKVHLLGGSPQQQLSFVRDYPDAVVVSVDGNAFTKYSTFGMVYSAEHNKWKRLSDRTKPTSEKLLLSAQNIVQAWKNTVGA